MSRKSAGNKADDNISEKVRKMKERQRHWMEERESAKQSDAAKKSARSTSDSSQSRRKQSETTRSKTSSLSWISKDDYQVSSKKSGGKSISRGTSRDLKSRESGYGSPPQLNNKHNIDSNRSRESRKSETGIVGYDDGQHKSTRAPNSHINSNSMLNNQTTNGAASFNDLADKVAERLQMKEQRRQELNQPSHKNEKPMSNHVCLGCNNLMAAPHSPVAIIPCGHTFCQICVAEYPKCPQCQSEVFSTAPNTVMQQIIEDFRKKQEKERLHQLEEQTRKYVEEYQNLNLRCESLADEADRILNSMESITEDMLKEKRVARKLEKENSDIQNRIKELQLEFHQNEELIKESSSNCHALEKNYDEEKQKLTLIEETIKTIRNSKERAKIMIQNLAPNLKLDDTF